MRFVYVRFEYDLEFVTYQLQWAAVLTDQYYNNTFFVALRPNACHDLLILEDSRSHTTTHHSR